MGAFTKTSGGDDHSLHRNIIQVVKGIDQWHIYFDVSCCRPPKPDTRWETSTNMGSVGRLVDHVKFVVFLKTRDPLQDRAHSSDT